MGKGVSIVVPNLLTHRGSVCVMDFKGELARICGRSRERFGRCVYLDPFHMFTRMPDCFNPLDSIESLSDCRDLGEELVVRTGEEREPHFLDSASMWLSGMIALSVAELGDDRNLQAVKRILSSQDLTCRAIELMKRSQAWNGILGVMAGGLENYIDREKGSVLTTCGRMLSWLDDPAILASTIRSTFDPMDLKRRGEVVSVFLICPPHKRKALAGWLRMNVGSMTRACMKGGLTG
jgi:type IV secretion system protein VirD4